MSARYVVATSQHEAESLAEDYGWETREEAAEHLKIVKAPPTDSYYAGQYRVYRIIDKVLAARVRRARKDKTT